MAEQTSRPNKKLYDRAAEAAIMVHDDYLMTLLRGLNPKRLSPADIDMLNLIIERCEGTVGNG